MPRGAYVAGDRKRLQVIDMNTTERINDFLHRNDPPAPFVAGSPTSEAAANNVRGKRAAQGREAVLAVLRQNPEGLTDEEGYEQLNMNPSTYRPRRVELVKAGLVQSNGVRKTHSGRMAQVWSVK
jgi:hypothetical protein